MASRFLPFSFVSFVAALALGGCAADAASGDAPAAAESNVTAGSCDAIAPESIAKDAHAFFLAQGLGSASDEKEIFDGTIWARWHAMKVVAAPSPDTCLVQMNLALETKEDNGETTVQEGDQWDLIAFDTKTRAMKRFEDVVEIPARLQLGIGEGYTYGPGGEKEIATNFYYVELTGEDATSALKSIYGQIQYSGLSAAISAKNIDHSGPSLRGEPDGAVSFDPTPARTWKLADAHYSLRRGSTAEILDVYSGQIDGDFAAYYSGSNGHVAPWNSIVRRWKLPTESTWHEVAPVDNLPPKTGGGGIEL
jgi:hypothetical protein